MRTPSRLIIFQPDDDANLEFIVDTLTVVQVPWETASKVSSVLVFHWPDIPCRVYFHRHCMPMTPRSVVIVSSINIDTTLSVRVIPKNGESAIGKRASPRLGGKGANVAVAVARSGLAPSRLCGAIGADGIAMRTILSHAGVDTSLVDVLPDSDTGSAYILLDEQGENRIIIVPGANALFTPPKDLPNVMRNAIVVLQLEIEPQVTREIALAAKAVGAFVVFNPSPVPKPYGPFGLLDDAWKCIDVVVLNEIEVAQITGFQVGSIEEAIWALQKRCVSTTHVVVTLGAKGVVISNPSDNSVTEIPGVLVELVVDTTGAGDTFTGYLVASLAAGQEFELSVREAIVAAAICVGREGAANAIPSREEVLEWIATNR